MRYAYLALAFLCVALVSILGFRGMTSTKPPKEVFPDTFFPEMSRQAKFKPQAATPFFADGRTDRPLPAGVVPRGELREDDFLYQGKNANGEFARGFPEEILINAQLMARGQERYNIYCLPCHGALGDGNGITKSYGMGATPTYHDDRLRQMPEGEIFNTITHGKNTMMSYADKLAPQDRWAVIAYVRALQRAAHGTPDDVPPSHKPELGLK